MERSIIANDIALPEGNARNGEIRPITIGTLAILERLGCESLPILMGLKQGNLLDNLEDLLLVLYVHVQDDCGLIDLVNRLYEDPESIHKESIMFGASKSTDEISSMLHTLLYDKERIEASTTEPVKKSRSSSSKNVLTQASLHG